MPSYNDKDHVPEVGKTGNEEEIVTLNNCEKEPIHIPGSIQPHGYLIGFSLEGIILHASANLEELSAGSAEKKPGKPLKEVFGDKVAGEVLERIAGLRHKKQFSLEVSKADGTLINFEALIHRQKDFFILELSTAEGNNKSIDLDFFNESMQQLQEAASPAALAGIVAAKVREITGFGRVMVYHFLDDNSGEVIAEAKEEEMDSFIGLRYPSTDIPRQARDLYLLNPIRLIPDVHYSPVAIASIGGDDKEPTPLDLSFAHLRSVSPIHIQYLKNMKVGASMSVSIIKKDRLWGLIACHHPTAHLVSYQNRQLCELLSRAFVMVLGEKEDLLLAHYRQQIREVKNHLFHRISSAEKFTEGLYKEAPTVQDLIRSSGCVISFGDEYIALGITPTKEEVLALTTWIQKNEQEEVFFTDQLPEIYPAAERFKEKASGIIAVAISQIQKEYIIWFRPEVVQTVNWAGKQEKSIGAAGEVRLNPRNSFKEWTELVRNQSEPWLPLELEAAKELRGLIVDVVLRMSGQLKLRADILTRLNNEMNSAKSEIDSFAYIAAHDLKEPVRGMQSYASFVLEDYGAIIDEEGRKKLQTLIRLSEHTQQLIDSLLQFSRLGRMELELEEVEVKSVLTGVMDVFSSRLLEERAVLEIQDGEWPRVRCDKLRISEVFMNFISNALKYNDKDKKVVRIGYRKALESEQSPSGYVFFVQDNGIGIHPKFHDDVFIVFRRLNSRTAYGGGTGAGLTITRKIIEKHNGKIWLDSAPGKGSCFYFTF